MKNFAKRGYLGNFTYFCENFLLPLYKIWITIAKLNTADIGFEDQIWKAADKMCSSTIW